MAYLHHYYEPDNAREHIRMEQRAKAYQIVDNDLYKTPSSVRYFTMLARLKAKSNSQKFTQESVEVT
jgi:hypothetical protein